MEEEIQVLVRYNSATPVDVFARHFVEVSNKSVVLQRGLLKRFCTDLCYSPQAPDPLLLSQFSSLGELPRPVQSGRSRSVVSAATMPVYIIIWFMYNLA